MIDRLQRSAVIAVACLLAAPMHAATASPKSNSAPRQTPSATDDTSPKPVTAEDVLEALRRRRPANDPIDPASAQGGQRIDPTSKLLPEGQKIVRHTGHLRQEDDWYLFVSEDDAERLPVKVLPNNTLEVMVRSNVGVEDPIRFVVSGEVTVFENENYLLISVAMRAPKEKVTEDPKPQQPVAPLAKDASAADILERMRNQTPEQTMLPQRTSRGAPARPTQAARAMVTDGTPLTSRPGRLVKDGKWWTFVFESDHPDFPEPPMRLLPNKSVELMVAASSRGASGLVFIVSGEVTAYYGENYLLPKVAMRRAFGDNFSK